MLWWDLIMFSISFCVACPKSPPPPMIRVKVLSKWFQGRILVKGSDAELIIAMHVLHNETFYLRLKVSSLDLTLLSMGGLLYAQPRAMGFPLYSENLKETNTWKFLTFANFLLKMPLWRKKNSFTTSQTTFFSSVKSPIRERVNTNKFYNSVCICLRR